MYVYAQLGPGWPKFQVHQFVALFLTVLIAALLAFELGQLGLSGARCGEHEDGPRLE